MHARDTKSVILDTAVRLFNQHDSQSVSTNRIAAEMSISVGNLYYHFNNKEDIIRTLYDRMAAEVDALWSEIGNPTISRLREIFEQQIQQMWEYRFFQRERLALLNRDPLLSKKNHAVRQRRREEIEAIMNGLIDAGVLSEPEDAETIPALVKAIWIVSENWLTFLELEGISVNRKNIRAGADLIMQIFRPYLTHGAITNLKQ
jgi:AcrR family transcriptional regulator